MKLSIVATMYRSVSTVDEFVRRICDEAKKITNDYELILVDDGSPDDSLQSALTLQKSNPHLSVIELSRNFGHHKAMMTGLEHSKGDLVFLIDIDLEESPELLNTFYAEMTHGKWDVVYGVQQTRNGTAFFGNSNKSFSHLISSWVHANSQIALMPTYGKLVNHGRTKRWHFETSVAVNFFH